MIMIDEGTTAHDLKWGFKNQNKELEYVEICGGVVQIYTADTEKPADIYVQDIPSLIKALTAAYDYSKGKTI